MISKPSADSVPGFYKPYISLVPDDGELLQHLSDIITETKVLVNSLTEEQLLFRYAEGKWNMKDIIVHLSDCERVITYRAMRFGRADKTNLPGFDENLFVDTALASNRSVPDILEELTNYRRASISFINSLSEEALDKQGTANGYPLTCRLLVNHLYGHHKHHLNIYRERYLK
jgi:hypothetical protein